MKRWISKRSWVVEAADADTDPVEFWPQGGGFLHRMPSAEFHAEFKPAPLPGWKVVQVSGDWCLDGEGCRTLYPAYSDGRRWNGWAVPMFTPGVAKVLCGLIPALTYDEIGNRFLIKGEPAFCEEDNYVEEQVILVEGEPVKVFAIGAALGWTWEIWD